MIKVLRVAAELYPAFYGGGQIHVHEMSKLQSQMNCEVTVLTCNYNSTAKTIIKDGYKIINHKARIRLYGNPITPSIFTSLIKLRNEFDILHAHDTLFFTTNLTEFVRRLGSPPLVITNHGLISQTAPLWLSNLYYSLIGYPTLNSADKIICYNNVEKEKVINLGVPTEKIEVIPNGVNTNIFKPRRKKKNYVQILWVGRYKPGKDIETLVKAAKILSNRHDNLKFLFVGKGPLKKYIEDHTLKLGVSDKIKFLDNVPNDKMPDIYNKSDIFVLPSIDEGIPRTILEAMACGLPVVCTNLPQLVDLIKDCGALVPVRSPNKLAETLSNMISNESLARKFGANGRKKVVKNNSWENTVKRTIKLYEGLIY